MQGLNILLFKDRASFVLVCFIITCASFLVLSQNRWPVLPSITLYLGSFVGLLLLGLGIPASYMFFSMHLYSCTHPHTGTYTQGACYSRVDPTPVKNPTLVAHSPMALSLLDITPAEVARPEFLEYFSGSKTVPGSEPASHCYCGHQFGYFSGQLGDGCAQWVSTPGLFRGFQGFWKSDSFISKPHIRRLSLCVFCDKVHILYCKNTAWGVL